MKILTFLIAILSAKASFANESLGQPLKQDVSKLDAYTPDGQGCTILVSISESRLFKDQPSAQKFCNDLHAYLRTGSACFPIKAYQTLYQASYRYDQIFTGKGSNWGSARTAAYKGLNDYLEDKRFDRTTLTLNISFLGTCEDQ